MIFKSPNFMYYILVKNTSKFNYDHCSKFSIRTYSISKHKTSKVFINRDKIKTVQASACTRTNVDKSKNCLIKILFLPFLSCSSVSSFVSRTSPVSILFISAMSNIFCRLCSSRSLRGERDNGRIELCV
jgi:hypothetical protein